MSFNQQRPFHIKFILETLLAWDDFDKSRREKLLSDPWEFKKFLAGITATKALSMREILCFFVHPSYFEAITLLEKKKEFAEEFGNLLESPTGDDDKDLLAIRKELSKTYGEEFHFFGKKIRGETVNVGAGGEATEDLEVTMKALLEQLGQIIVYGPPGTGKTREAKRVALAILSGEEPSAEAGSTEQATSKRPA